jgi:hypothetical protein
MASIVCRAACGATASVAFAALRRTCIFGYPYRVMSAFRRSPDRAFNSPLTSMSLRKRRLYFACRLHLIPSTALLRFLRTIQQDRRRKDRLILLAMSFKHSEFSKDRQAKFAAFFPGFTLDVLPGRQLRPILVEIFFAFRIQPPVDFPMFELWDSHDVVG